MKRLKNISAAMAIGMAVIGTPMTVFAQPEADQQENSTPVLADKPEAGSEEADANEGQGLKDKNQEPDKNQVGKKGKAEKKETSDQGPSWFWTIVALLFGIAGSGVGVLSFLELRKLQEKFGLHRKSNKKDFNQATSQNEVLQQQVSNANQRIDANQAEIAKLKSDLIALKNMTQASQYHQQGPAVADQQSHHQAAYAAPAQPARETVRLYCGVPRGGVFSNPSTTQSRQSLYVIMDNGGNTCNYTFLDDRDSAIVAARSTSDFLDPGCVISGNQNANFSKVRTITPGKVRKTANGWAIESKAVVELV